MMNMVTKLVLLSVIGIGSLFSFSAFAEQAEATGPAHKMVIQVNTKDKLSQKMAMINATNLTKMLGEKNVAVEVVVYGPGLSLLNKDSVFSTRIRGLQKKGVRFSVCNGTIKRIVRKTGKEPDLLEGIHRVKTGALRILELQEQGYAYMRP